MIDTVVITLKEADKIIWQPERFTPSLKDVRKDSENKFGARLFTKYTCNIPASKGYYPRLTVTPRWDNGLQIPLRIEFSVPKLIFGNNLDELEETDWDLVIETLRNRLKEMGIMVFTAQLENAQVSVVHYSKNIVLTEHYTASSAIKALAKLDVSKKLDINNRHFQNQGHALYFDCGSYQIVIYDKIQDINKNKRQAVDKDKTPQQMDLFNFLQESKLPLEVLRFEIRLTKKAKLNSIFQKFGFNPNPTFKQVFSKEIAQKVIMHYWDFIAHDKNLFLLRFNEADILKQVIDYQKASDKKLPAIDTLGLAQIVSYSKQYGLRNLRTTLSTLYSDRTWFRLSNYFDQIENITKSNKQFQFINDIELTLDSFQPYRVVKGNNNLLKWS